MKTRIASFFVMVLVTMLFTGCDIEGPEYKYNVHVPKGAHADAGKLKFKPVSAEQKKELESQGFKFVGTPINMRLGEQEHVFLNELATITFGIPGSIKEEDYYHLLGVIFTDGEPVYMVPNATDLQKKKVTFKTSHFSVGALVWKTDEELLNILAPRIANGGYHKSMRDNDLKKTFSDRMSDVMEDAGLGDDMLLGRIVRKVAADNEYISDAVELINSDDPATAIKDKAVEKLQEKTLEMLFAAYQKKYKEHGKVDKDNAIVKTLEEHLTSSNVKDWATKLGSGISPYELAKDYCKDFAVDKMKSFATKMVPIIDLMKKEAEVIKFLKDFWVDNNTEEAFQIYLKLSPDSNGRISDDNWGSIANTYMAAIIRQYKIDGKMTEAEIRQMFEQRIKKKNEIDEEEIKVRKQFELWKKNLLFQRGHCRFDYDMDLTVRLTILHNLTERFRKEFMVNGRIPRNGDWDMNTDEEILANMVYQYLTFFPDTKKFYAWAQAQGFYGGRLQRDLDELNRDRSWYLVRVDVNRTESSSGEYYWYSYKASEGNHSYSVGSKQVSNYGWPIQSASFEATCTSPPKVMNYKDVVRLHVTVKTGSETDYVWCVACGVNFDIEECGMGAVTIWATRSTQENLIGSMSVCSCKGSPKSGECDYVLVIPSGSKDALWAVNFSSCGSRTHWVYQCRGILK